MKKLVSPLPWVGSKRQLRDHIITLIPKHICYAEPFAGGAWVYLGKQPSQVEVLNDVNGDLINLYRAIQKTPNELYDAIWYLLPSRELYYHTKSVLTSETERSKLTDIERAAMFFFHIKNAFGGRFGSGFAFGKTRPPRTVLNYDLLMALRDRLAHTYIENVSFERIIQNYDAPDTFFYCDPPYIMETKDKCYQFEFSSVDHANLSAILAGIKGRFLLSYGDHPTVRKAYRNFTIKTTAPVTYTLSGKATQKCELLISNY